MSCWNLEGDYTEADKARVHVFPASEEILHNLEGEFCFCNPRIEVLTNAKVVLHNSTDQL